MKVGFTGTQEGMSVRQRKKLISVLRALSVPYPIDEFHHGDCIGADKQFHEIVNDPERTYIHPPINEVKRAWCYSKHILKSKPYLDRNHDIVNSTDVLIVAPKTNQEVLRSGTWATLRYALVIGKIVMPIYPIDKDEL